MQGAEADVNVGRVHMYRAVTQGIEVSVEPFYLEDQSEPDENRYVWGYRITIANNSTQTVQLRSRYWQITDANGYVEEVRGPCGRRAANSRTSDSFNIHQDAR